MIQFLSDNIDQLDLALDQLAISDRNFDRFALMLIDNIVELTLHRYAQDIANVNEMRARWGGQESNQNVIMKALGQNFDAKVKAASKTGLIDKDMCGSILNLHSYRNTTYHKGLRHEKILHSLALFYFRNACEILKAYEPELWGWCSTDRISHRAMKYIGVPHLGDHKKNFNAAYDRLNQVAKSMDEDFIGDLSADMAETIDSTDQDIQFLVDNNPDDSNRLEVIIDAQVWSFAFTDEAKSFSISSGCVETTIGPYIEWLSNNYDWPTKTDPIGSWRSRLKKLSNEKCYHKALTRYCEFMRQTENIRSQITEAVIQLDGHIQEQIDMMRGK